MAASRFETLPIDDKPITSTGSAADYYTRTGQATRAEPTTVPIQEVRPTIPEPTAPSLPTPTEQTMSAAEVARVDEVPAIPTPSETAGLSSSTPVDYSSDAGREGRGNDPTKSLEQSAKDAALSKIPEYKVSPNQLHDYPSYTYSLSLHALTPENYKEIVNSHSYTPTNVLIASAGRAGDTLPRNPEFADDFFFDNFEMETVIGLNAEAMNSNAILCSFTVIEPYGVTLLNRIINASDAANNKNYLTMPYLIQLDFFGYTDQGIPVKIPGITKWVPIRFTSMKMKLSTKGAEYAITAVPFNHQAFSEIIGTTPIRLEVSASTVGDFFLANSKAPLAEADTSDSKTVKDKLRSDAEAQNSLTAAVEKQNAALASRQNISAGGTDLNGSLEYAGLPGNEKPEDPRIEQNALKEKLAKEAGDEAKIQKEKLDAPIHVKSYTGAFNAWLSALVDDKKILVNDFIKFEIEEGLANATFPPPQDVSPGSTQFPDAKRREGVAVREYDHTRTTIIAINQGTSIISVIGMAMRNSSYISDQITDPIRRNVESEQSLADLEGRPLEWFKIIPKIELLEFDKSRNAFAKKITYGIYPYLVYNTVNETAPQGQPRGYTKDYQYMFTGKNKDILSLDMNFDSLYYTAMPVGGVNLDTLSGAQDAISKEDSHQSGLVTVDEAKDRLNAAKGHPSLHPERVPVVGPVGAQTAGLTAKEAAATQLQNQILTSPSGDMLNFTMRIVGDPDFIKQDDYFYGWRPLASLKETNFKTPNGSIVTDLGEIFINLTFNTPGDYNKEGLARPGYAKYNSSVFSGRYRVLKVKSIFSNGKFEQELQIVRFPDQPTQGLAPKPAATTDERTTSSSTPSDNRAIVTEFDEFLGVDAAVIEQASDLHNLPVFSYEYDPYFVDEASLPQLGDVEVSTYGYDPYGVADADTRNINE